MEENKVYDFEEFKSLTALSPSLNVMTRIHLADPI